MGMIWLREQIIHGGGPDWLERDQPQQQIVQEQVAQENAENVVEPANLIDAEINNDNTVNPNLNNNNNNNINNNINNINFNGDDDNNNNNLNNDNNKWKLTELFKSTNQRNIQQHNFEKRCKLSVPAEKKNPRQAKKRTKG